jgi:hypothetical protein
MSAAVNQQGGDITEGEGRHHDELLVELVGYNPNPYVRPFLCCSAPNKFPRPLSRFVSRGVRVSIADPLADCLCGLVRNPRLRPSRRRNGQNGLLTGAGWRTS